MKQLLYSICFVVVCMGLYFNEKETNSFDDELTVWVTEEEFKVLSEVNESFETKYRVKINRKVISDDESYAKLPTLTKLDDYPDIINVRHVMISDFVDQRLIVPLNDVFDSFEVIENAKPGLKVKGNYYGVPYQAMTDILYYNTKTFPQGVSSADLQNYDHRLLLDYKNLMHINPFVTGFGGAIVGSNKFDDTNFYDIRLNSEESILGFKAMIKLLGVDAMYDEEGELYEQFIQERADLMIAPASLAQSLQNNHQHLGYQEIPQFVDDQMPTTYMMMDTYQITSLSEQDELAQQYLKFLISEPVMIARYDEYEAITPLDQSLSGIEDDYYDVVKKQLHRAEPTPNQTEFNQLFLPYQKAVKEFVILPDQIQLMLDQAVKEIDKALEPYLE